MVVEGSSRAKEDESGGEMSDVVLRINSKIRKDI
jgi:hypothetical protein